MQRQRIVDAMGLLWRCRHPRDDEPNPMAAPRVNHEDLPIEVEKHIERRIARRRHILLVIILKQLEQATIRPLMIMSGPEARGPEDDDAALLGNDGVPATEAQQGGRGAAVFGGLVDDA